MSGEPNLELKVITLNINVGHNKKLMEECRTLREYAQYVDKVRRYSNEMELNTAVERAVRESIQEGILKEFLQNNRAEVVAMSIFEYNVSIQGQYESMHREPYTDYCFLNSLQDDRGILVKMKNGEMLSTAFDKVAVAKKPQGNSFRKNITIQVYNETLLKEYQQLKDLNDTISEFKKNRLGPVLNHLKKRKKALAEKRKKAKAAGIPYESVLQRENELKKYEKEIKQRYDEYVRENYTKPISYFRTLTKSMKFYEVLNNIQLIIHIQADDAVLHDLEQHWTDIKSIGRSEDMVDIQQAKVIDLVETGNISATSEYSAYIDSEALKLDEETDERKVYPYKIRNRVKANGTRYYLNKNYELKDGKRIFEKKSVVYISQYGIDKIGNGIYLDQEDGKNYIVNFL